MLSVPDGDSLPNSTVPLPGWRRAQAAKCPPDGGRMAGVGTHWVSLGSGKNAGMAARKVPAEGGGMTKAGSAWVSGEEVASGAAVGRISPGPP